jgi:integrase
MSQSKIYFKTRPENGIIYYGAKDEAGKIAWHSTKCKTKSEAKAFVAEQSPVAVVAQPAKAVIALDAYYELYKSYKSNVLRKTTIDMHELAHSTFLRCIGNKPLNQYTLEDVERFKKILKNEGKSNTTINIYTRCEAAVFNHAVILDYLAKSPFKFSALLKANHNIAFLQAADIDKLMAVVKIPVFKDFYRVACLTGLRVGELINLQWTDIDFKTNSIRITNTATFQTKTGKSRVVPMHVIVREILERRVKAGGTYVFAKSNGYQYERGYVSAYFKQCIRKAKLNPNLHMHSTRHSTASLLVNAGVPIHEIKEILGHSSVNLTSNTYSHLLPSTLVSSINRIQL